MEQLESHPDCAVCRKAADIAKAKEEKWDRWNRFFDRYVMGPVFVLWYCYLATMFAGMMSGRWTFADYFLAGAAFVCLAIAVGCGWASYRDWFPRPGAPSRGDQPSEHN